LRPCFGRGDADYARVEDEVLGHLKTMTGHPHLVRMQGSASLAMEIMALNFLCGRVLVVSTGYYSDRLKWLAASAVRRTGAVTESKASTGASSTKRRVDSIGCWPAIRKRAAG
jgi:2-aminoethylphosphonate-pyruvate transaminase